MSIKMIDVIYISQLIKINKINVKTEMLKTQLIKFSTLDSDHG